MGKWTDQRQYFQGSSEQRIGIDGELFEFGWNIFLGHYSGYSVRDSDNKTVRTARLEEFEHRVIFMSVFND